MKQQKVLASIVLGGLAACAVGTAAWLHMSAYAEQAEADTGNVLYTENFDNMSGTVGENFNAEDGKIKSSAQFSKFVLEGGKFTYDWKFSVDVVFPEIAEGSGFFGLNVHGMAEKSFEFTVENGVGNAGGMVIKYDNTAITNSDDLLTNLEVVPGREYTYEIIKYNDTITMSLDGVEYLKLQRDDIDKTSASAMDIYSFNNSEMTVDNLNVTRQARELDIDTDAGNLYSENFDSRAVGDNVAGEGTFTVTENKSVVSGAGYSRIDCGEVNFSNDWTISVDVKFPAEKYIFFGINVMGLQSGKTYDFTLEKKFLNNVSENFSIIKRHSPEEMLYNSFLNNGSHPALIDNMVHNVVLHKSGKTLTEYVDGKAVSFITSDDITDNGTAFNIYTTDAGVEIDNIVVKQVMPTGAVKSVSLIADKQELSVSESATFTTTVNPADAAIISGYKWYVDNAVVDGEEGSTFTYTATTAGSHYIKCEVDGVTSNTIAIKAKSDVDVDKGEILYTEGFNGKTEGEAVGENFTATADGKIVAGAGFAQYNAGELDFTNDWILSADVNFPADKDGFFGFNINGLQANKTYEFSVQKTPAGGYSTIKINPDNQTLYHSNDHGTNPALLNNLTYTVSLLKVGKTFTVYVDGVMCATLTIEEVTGSGSNFNIYTFNLDGVKIDNLTVQEVRATTTIDSVTIISDKSTISTMQKAKLSVKVLPSTALIESIVWKVDDIPVADEVGTEFTFGSETAGSYRITCTVNGVESDEIIITVNEASEEEKDALYYESFDSGSKWGSFDVRDGAAHTVAGSPYHRYDYTTFNMVRDFDVTFKVTFNGEIANDAYVGFVAKGLTNSTGEVEFNIHRAPTIVSVGGTEEVVNVSNLVIKVNGVEKYFSNDSEKGGRLDSLTLETGRTYTYRLVRYNDQFEMYIDDTLAIKYYLKDAASEPNIPEYMFFYTFNADGTSITIDDMKIKPAQPITDRVEPPVVEVESAYVTASSISIKKGESSTLTVQSSPFDATVTSYAWYVNDTLIEGATEKSYVFTATEAGEYVFKCVVNGTITSETKTVTVKDDTPINPPANGGKSDNKGLIIGLSVAGGVVALAAAGTVAGIIVYKKRKH